MTTEEQIKALAELDGWERVDVMTNSFADPSKLVPDGQRWFNKIRTERRLPDYLESYDAIIPLVKKCWEAQLFAPEKFYQAIPNYYPHILTFIQYTSPAQLAEALLKATGKWNSKVSYHADNAGGAHGKDTNDK